MARMKFRNGTGSVVKLKGKRRKPYLVRSSATYCIDDNGNLKDIRKIIGYASTKEEAFQMLSDYKANPYDLDKAKVTFSQLYEDWSKSYYLGVSKSTKQSYISAYKHCYAIYNKPYRDLKLADYQRMFDECIDMNGKPLSQDALKRTRMFLGLISTYAVQNEIITKSITEYIDIKRYKDRDSKHTEHKVFNDKELLKLWTKQNDYMARIILVLIMTGCRINCEFFNIKKEDVNLEEKFIDIKQSKTKNGLRLIPIANTIYPIIKEWCDDDSSEYLVHTAEGKKIDYRTWLDTDWHPYMEELEMNHLPYDTRHTFNSLLANLEINTEIRERLMGHSSNKVNEKVYTHFEKEKLLEIVNRI